MNKTNLFIVGTAKSGTTSFHNYLHQHPNISMSEIKETNFFSFDEIEKNNLYYNDNSVKSEKLYLNLFRNSSDEKYLGESSVSYLFYESVPQRLFDYNPDAKILIFLRNPAHRAFSHYLMDYSAGYFNYSFEEIIQNEGIPKQVYQQIVSLGMYADQVKRYYTLFGKEQVKIILFEEASLNLLETLKEIESFLKLSNYDKYDKTKRNIFLGSGKGIVFVLYRSQQIKKILKLLLPKRITDKFKSTFLKGTRKPVINEENRNFLKKIYSKNIEETSSIIGRDLKKLWSK
jgi:hypothetical protein